MSLGGEVGYQFRFERKRRDDTRVVFLTEVDQLAKLVLQELRLLAHGHELALADRYRPPAVRVRDLQIDEDLDVVLEETGVLLQEIGDLLGRGQRGSS